MFITEYDFNIYVDPSITARMHHNGAKPTSPGFTRTKGTPIFHQS